MENSSYFNNLKSVHFIGIGGISMSALAKSLIHLGIKVSGSDTAPNGQISDLIKLGASIFIGHNAKNVVNKDAVVYTSAISVDNPELIEAKRLGIRIYKRSEMLSVLLGGVKKVIAVSGSHGKTTATAMIAQIFITAGLDPIVYLGGEYSFYKNFRVGKPNFAIVEACEYKKNFLDIKRDACVILNVDNDHFDSYSGMEDMIDAFNKFSGKNLTVINADDKNSERVYSPCQITFGIKNKAVYTAKHVKNSKAGISFSVYEYNAKLGKINLKINGIHNVYNALSAIAIARQNKIDFNVIKTGLENFYGVKRRGENIGKLFGATCIADYAHHPNEIKATLSALQDNGENTITVFQPHTYSRTKILMEDFVDALFRCKNLIIYKTYPAREQLDVNASAEKLYQQIISKNNNAIYCFDRYNLIEKLKEITDKTKIDKILFLGAGDIYDIATNLCEKQKL